MLLNRVGWNREDVAVSQENSPGHFAVDGFRERQHATIERNRQYIAVQSDVSNAVNLLLVQTDFRQLRQHRLRPRGRLNSSPTAKSGRYHQDRNRPKHAEILHETILCRAARASAVSKLTPKG